MKDLPKVVFFCSLLLAMPALAEIHSKLIIIDHRSLMADDAGGFHLVQMITNTSAQRLWLTVRQGSCEKSEKLNPRETATFACDVADLQAGKVAVEIAIFADAARTQNLETLRDAMQFDRDDVRIATENKRRHLGTMTYEGIAYFEKFGFGTALRQFGTKPDGRLSISSTTVEYADSKRRVTIPLTNIDRLDGHAVGDVASIFVDYETADGEKRAIFQPIGRRDDARSILDSLNDAMKAARDGTEDVPGEALGEPGLRRQVVRMIRKSEKFVAPDCASPKVVDTKNLEKPANGNWAERWVVDRCGTQVAYVVGFKSDGNGGTAIALALKLP